MYLTIRYYATMFAISLSIYGKKKTCLIGHPTYYPPFYFSTKLTLKLIPCNDDLKCIRKSIPCNKPLTTIQTRKGNSLTLRLGCEAFNLVPKSERYNFKVISNKKIIMTTKTSPLLPLNPENLLNN